MAHAFNAASLYLALTLGGVGFGLPDQSTTGRTRTPSESVLHQRALKNGGHLVESAGGEGDAVCATVAELAERAPVIVVGKALNYREHLALDGAHVTTDVAVSVREVLRGNVHPSSVIVVSLPGGRHRFADGVSVRQNPGAVLPVRSGAFYVLFLRQAEVAARVRGTAQPRFELVPGSQGRIELDFEADRVRPGRVAVGDPIGRKYAETGVKEFLVELHRVVPR